MKCEHNGRALLWFSLVPPASCDRCSRKTITGCFIEVDLIGRTISLAVFCIMMQLDKSLFKREQTNRLIRTKRRERKKSSKEISTIQRSSINWKEGKKKNSNIIQCSGMSTDVESAQLLPVTRTCSLTAGQEFLFARGGDSDTLTDKIQAPPPALPSVPPLLKSVRSDWLQ